MDDMHIEDYKHVHDIQIPGGNAADMDIHILADNLVGGDIASHSFLLMQQQQQQQHIFLDVRYKQEDMNNDPLDRCFDSDDIAVDYELVSIAPVDCDSDDIAAEHMLAVGIEIAVHLCPHPRVVDNAEVDNIKAILPVTFSQDWYHHRQIVDTLSQQSQQQ
jgi:hypothetical protein